MKRWGNLYPQVIAWDNLWRAARRAARAKPLSGQRMAFEMNLERELVRLRRELESGAYRPGAYRSFAIRDPKLRIISAAPYRDRVVHHCLCNVIEPLYDRGFLPQNYANRRGRGLHRAVRAAGRLVNASPWLLKADIRKYFPSIDHAILKEIIRCKIKCRRTLELIDRIIDGSNEQEWAGFHFPGDDLLTPVGRRRGLPIGNLTSQLFANIYLAGLDRFIVHELRLPRYVRYVDDLLIGSDDKASLLEARQAIEDYLQGLCLKLHDTKTVVFPARRGLTFLGFHFTPGRVRVGKRCGRRFARRLRQLQRDYAAGQTDLAAIRQVIAAYNGHLAHAASQGLRRKLLGATPFVRGQASAGAPEGTS
ncbi:MAG TPA: RNA-dependent DNA polymerase [Thiotrichales bacterium]|nr:RNA-dependent DNA polymerase [Thiotrichales bacterium]